MMTITPLVSKFTAIGELQDLTVKSDGRVKYLLLSSDEDEYWIKVAKDQPKNLGKHLQPGCKLKVEGMLKQKIAKDKAEYKAYSIQLISAPETIATPVIESHKAKSDKPKKTKTKAKVLVCKKSNCWNKGGKKVCQQLETELEKRGIRELVEIKTTGCLKKCKKAPNVIVLPDKKQHVRVSPKQVPAMVEEHFSEII